MDTPAGSGDGRGRHTCFDRGQSKSRVIVAEGPMKARNWRMDAGDEADLADAIAAVQAQLAKLASAVQARALAVKVAVSLKVELEDFRDTLSLLLAQPEANGAAVVKRPAYPHGLFGRSSYQKVGEQKWE